MNTKKVSRFCLTRVHVSSLLTLFISLSLGIIQPSHAQNDNSDTTFAQLRDAARKNDIAKSQLLAAQLSTYPIPSYVEYFKLKPQIYDTAGNPRLDAPDTEIRTFLEKYQGDAIADRLRNDWLLALAKRRDWTTFDQEYPKFSLNDDTQLKCYAAESRLLKGQQVVEDARNILFQPKYYGDACPELIQLLVSSGQFTRLEGAARAHWALESNYATIASKIGIGDNDSVAAVTKLARTDPIGAQRYLLNIENNLSPIEQGEAWGVVGQFMARALMPNAIQAYERQIKAGGDAFLSDDTHEWKVRSALREKNWPMIIQAVEAMPKRLLEKDPAWIYWYGRALAATGRNAEAQQQFERISTQYNFYGQLALEELGRPISIPAPATVSESEIQAMAQKPGFARAQKFYEMNFRFEGNREWNWELRGLSDTQLLAAAEYAKRIKLFDRTVNSADRTLSQHDFAMRYLMPFQNIVQSNTSQIGLDMAWVYGLVRQESRFVMQARSSVGASGLMQVMPATGRWVAKKIGLGNLQNGELNDLNTNILIGTNYLKMVLDDLGGSWPLATAAYNAGPSRSKNWRGTLSQKVEGAIFAESIPFDETRDYVKNVLSNATYYATLISGKPQSLKARLGEVGPY